MSTNIGPNTIKDGLVLSLDSANKKSLNIPSQSNHGYADWYCFVSGTATYSIISSTGGTIYENNSGTITTLVTATTPQRGTISIVAGRTYYGNVPINLVVEDQQHSIAPLTMMGAQFWHVSIRNNPTTYYIYSPYSNATINFYDNTVGGITATPTSTTSLSAGQVTTITSNNLTNQWISSNTPILVSATQTSADKTILSPMTKYVYQRYSNYFNTTNNTTATNSNAYVVYDSTYNVMNMNIADGSGSESAQGLGLEYLSDIYSWGNVLSDYTIVFPYNTTVTAEYWDGNKWIIWDTHVITNGSITDPPRITRDGTNGAGMEAASINGTSTNIAAGATLWRWVGTQPFYLCINDSADDEFSVLGWMQSTTSNPRSGISIKDISNNISSGQLLNGPTFSFLNNGCIVLDGSDDYFYCGPIPYTGSSTSSVSWEIWICPLSTSGNIMSMSSTNPQGGWNMPPISAVSQTFTGKIWNNNRLTDTSTYTLGQWYQVVLVWDYSNTTQTFYVNGVSKASQSGISYSASGTNNYLYFGQQNSGADNSGMFKGKYGQINVYGNKALTATQVKNNFNSLRSKYGI